MTKKKDTQFTHSRCHVNFALSFLAAALCFCVSSFKEPSVLEFP